MFFLDLPRPRVPRGALVQLGLQLGVDGSPPEAARFQVHAASPEGQPFSKVKLSNSECQLQTNT